jgi:SPP1 gp7 family putative phage head morphogenesis protein
VATSLREGLESGEGLPQLTDRLENVLGVNRSRAQRIARTQTASAVSTGRHEGMKSAGVEFKAWITSQDDAVRPSHRQAGADYADGIPIEEPFIVDGEALSYPGDPTGSAANIINCRCLQVARLNRVAAAPTEFIKYVGADGVRPNEESK